MWEHDVILHDVVRWYFLKNTKCVRKFRMAAVVCLTMASHTACSLHAGCVLVTYILVILVIPAVALLQRMLMPVL